jgi:hypothetical protein
MLNPPSFATCTCETVPFKTNLEYFQKPKIFKTPIGFPSSSHAVNCGTFQAGTLTHLVFPCQTPLLAIRTSFKTFSLTPLAMVLPRLIVFLLLSSSIPQRDSRLQPISQLQEFIYLSPAARAKTRHPFDISPSNEQIRVTNKQSSCGPRS